MEELVNRLRELASIPAHCENVADCDKCSKEDICLSFTNKRIIETATQAADAIEELTRENESLAKSVNEASEILRKRWIPVEERLPEERQSVLVHRDDGGIFIFEYFTTSPTDECWIDDHLNVYSAYSVTHWMPLPELPKEE